MSRERGHHHETRKPFVRIINDRGKGAMMSEEFHVTGDEILAKVKELIHEGNIRSIVIKDEEGKTLINIPLTVGVVGTVIAPQLAAVGALAALLSHGTIVVEKEF